MIDVAKTSTSFFNLGLSKKCNFFTAEVIRNTRRAAALVPVLHRENWKSMHFSVILYRQFSFNSRSKIRTGSAVSVFLGSPVPNWLREWRPQLKQGQSMATDLGEVVKHRKSIICILLLNLGLWFWACLKRTRAWLQYFWKLIDFLVPNKLCKSTSFLYRPLWL